jgi:hypothetical protein
MQDIRTFAENVQPLGPLPTVTNASESHPSFGDRTIDKEHAKVVERSQNQHKIDPTRVVKPSGQLTDLALLIWNYAPDNGYPRQQYACTADPANSCMRLAGIKFVGSGDNRKLWRVYLMLS